LRDDTSSNICVKRYGVVFFVAMLVFCGVFDKRIERNAYSALRGLIQTRREPFPGGFVAASMLLRV
jgi:hypothetical protein